MPTETVHRVFLDDWGKPLLVLHAMVAFALAGGLTHLLMLCGRFLRGELPRARQVRLWTRVSGGCFAAVFALGLLMYPHYRYHVRGLVLDRSATWASNLFDIKENFAALGLPLALGLFLLGLRLPDGLDERDVRVIGILTLTLWCLVAFNVVSGLLVTSVRGV